MKTTNRSAQMQRWLSPCCTGELIPAPDTNTATATATAMTEPSGGFDLAALKMADTSELFFADVDVPAENVTGESTRASSS